jgi:hypothetical protein
VAVFPEMKAVSLQLFCFQVSNAFEFRKLLGSSEKRLRLADTCMVSGTKTQDKLQQVVPDTVLRLFVLLFLEAICRRYSPSLPSQKLETEILNVVRT